MVSLDQWGIGASRSNIDEGVQPFHLENHKCISHQWKTIHLDQ